MRKDLAYHLAAGPIAPWRLELIGRYCGALASYAPRLEARYPREDVEPLMMSALYVAALTYRPGAREFWTWYRVKLGGQLNRIRQRHARHRIGLKDARGRRGPPLRLVPLETAAVDARLSYRDRRDDEDGTER